MEYHFISVDFNPDVDKLLKRIGAEKDSDEAEDFLALLAKAAPLASPKAALGVARVDEADASGRVVLNGIAFQSELLAKNLEKVETAWPYLASCGRELYDFCQSLPDPFERYWVDEIMQAALTEARTAMEAQLAEKFYNGKTARMGPGSLPEWPIGQQVPLFRLLGPAVDYCGVTLTDTMLMLPNKSISGVFFPNEHGYVNCRLCPKERCPNRRAAYDEEMASSWS